MGNGWIRRLLYLSIAAAAIPPGLGSRYFAIHLPDFVAEYAGDTLWAWMVFFAVSFACPFATRSQRIGIAICLAYAVELSQLYQSPWIDAIRQTTIGGLALGFGFVWTDLVCYTVGVAVGALLDGLVFGNDRHDEHRNDACSYDQSQGRSLP